MEFDLPNEGCEASVPGMKREDGKGLGEGEENAYFLEGAGRPSVCTSPCFEKDCKAI